MFHSFINSQARSRYLPLFSHIFSFTQWFVRTAKFTILQVFFLFFLFFFFFVVVVDDYKIWSSDGVLVIYFYLKILVEFVHFILQDRFCVVRIPFVRLVKLQLLAQFPEDHLAHSVVPRLILFLC